MLKGILRYFIGCTHLRISGSCPERALNAMTRQGIGFFGARPRGDGITLWVRSRQTEEVRQLCFSLLLVCTPLKNRGAAVTLRRTRGKRTLLCALALVTAVLLLSNTVILRFDVTGCQGVSPARVLQALRQQGINIGTPVRDVSIRRLKPRVILNLPQVSWLTVNMKGSTAYVSVDARIEAPAVRDEELIMDLRSRLTGMVSSVDIYAGTSAVGVGDTVQPGDVLISARVESPFAGQWYVNPRGSVICDTWYKVTAAAPLSCFQKVYTGKCTTKYGMILGAKRINLSISTGNFPVMYDKIERCIDLPDFIARALPFTLYKTVYTPYTLQNAQGDGSGLAQALQAVFRQSIADTGQILDCSFDQSSDGDTLTVTLYAHCRQEAVPDC